MTNGAGVKLGMKRRSAVLVIAMTPLGFASACVEGATPDCSDPATACGPTLDGSPDRAETALPDAAQPDTGPVDAGSDTDALLLDLDAGDGG